MWRNKGVAASTKLICSYRVSKGEPVYSPAAMCLSGSLSRERMLSLFLQVQSPNSAKESISLCFLDSHRSETQSFMLEEATPGN